MLQPIDSEVTESGGSESNELLETRVKLLASCTTDHGDVRSMFLSCDSDAYSRSSNLERMPNPEALCPYKSATVVLSEATTILSEERRMLSEFLSLWQADFLHQLKDHTRIFR